MKSRDGRSAQLKLTAETCRKAGALGILAAIAVLTTAVISWPTPAVKRPAPVPGVAAGQTWTLPSLAAPSTTAADHNFWTPRPAVPDAGRPAVARSASVQTTSPADVPEGDPIAAAPRTLESRGSVEMTAAAPIVVPALPPAAVPAGSASARAGRALASAFKIAGTSVGAAFSRAF